MGRGQELRQPVGVTFSTLRARPGGRVARSERALPRPLRPHGRQLQHSTVGVRCAHPHRRPPHGDTALHAAAVPPPPHLARAGPRAARTPPSPTHTRIGGGNRGERQGVLPSIPPSRPPHAPASTVAAGVKLRRGSGQLRRQSKHGVAPTRTEQCGRAWPRTCAATRHRAMAVAAAK